MGTGGAEGTRGSGAAESGAAGGILAGVGRMLLKFLGWSAYGLALLLIAGIVAYQAFNGFIHSGVTAVPDVGGRPLVQARALLADNGLGVEVDEAGRYSESVPAGEVAEQQPRGGSLVKRRAVVRLIPSLGPQRFEVPDLAGKDIASAQLTLTAVGLRPGRVQRIFAGGAAPGTVVDQVPPAGAHAGAGSPVEILVSAADRGATYLMPDLLYRDVEQVQRYFAGHGFHIGSVKFEPYEGVPYGTVLRQMPLAGHPLRGGEAIALVAAADPRGLGL